MFSWSTKWSIWIIQVLLLAHYFQWTVMGIEPEPFRLQEDMLSWL